MDDFRAIIKGWDNCTLTSEQHTQVMAAVGIIDTLTEGTFRVQSLCQLIKASRDTRMTQKPALN